MRKANELREYLTRYNLFLKQNPERLHVFIDEGTVHCTGTTSLSHEYRYTVSLVLTDFPHDADTIILPLLAWLRLHQPEQMENPDRRANAISFDVEILNHNSVDLEIRLPLTERVIVRQIEQDGPLVAEHVAEPPHPDIPADGEHVIVQIPDMPPIEISIPRWRHPNEC